MLLQRVQRRHCALHRQAAGDQQQLDAEHTVEERGDAHAAELRHLHGHRPGGKRAECVRD